MRRTLMGVGDPLALVISHCWTVVALDICRRMMPAMGDVLLVVNAAIKHDNVVLKMLE